jgi:hypothetical protein
VNRFECGWEQEILDAVASRRWPDRCGPELGAHLSTCSSCTDLAEVAAALLHDGHPSGDDARVPDANIVWWRAQLRARQEAARLALVPIGTVQGIALACGVTVAALALWVAWPALTPFVEAIPAFSLSAPTIDAADAGAAASAAFANRGVQTAIAAWMILAPIALYFAMVKD